MIEFIVSHWWLWIIGFVTGIICYFVGIGAFIYNKSIIGTIFYFFGWALSVISWICIIITIVVEIIKYAVNL